MRRRPQFAPLGWICTVLLAAALLLVETPWPGQGPAAALAVVMELDPARTVASTEPLHVWVYFEDKPLAENQSLDQALAAAAAGLSPAALDRRQQRGVGAVVDVRDLPVASAYIDTVLGTGAGLREQSRWLNAVSVSATAGQIEAIAGLPFVSQISPVARMTRAAVPDASDPWATSSTAAPQDFYGYAQTQLAQIRIPEVHTLGYTGAGITIGVLDTGFKRTHQAFNYAGHSLVVLGEYDFIDNDANTADTTNNQHRHGTSVLGLMGAYQPGSYVGGAYNASFLLAKTEDVSQEVPAEEDDWVAGIEWLEQQGADLVTSSLGYSDWYMESQYDGNTAPTTKAADLAAAHGMAVINAMGNRGHDSNPTTSHLMAPADGNFVISVGAVDSSGVLASFSSDGPTADGRTKPEVLAPGVSDWVVNPDNDGVFSQGSGTSYAAPLVAATVALMLEAHPDWTVEEIRQALLSTASGGGTFDPLYLQGYGIIDAYAAITVPEPATWVMLAGIAPLWLWTAVRLTRRRR